jgi:hypothetical protein
VEKAGSYYLDQVTKLNIIKTWVRRFDPKIMRLERVLHLHSSTEYNDEKSDKPKLTMYKTVNKHSSKTSSSGKDANWWRLKINDD